MPWPARLLALLFCLAFPARGWAADAAASGADACRGGGTSAQASVSQARVAAAPARDGSLALSDGRRLVPAGVVLPTALRPDADLVARSAAAVADLLDGRFVTLGATQPDRHGRLTGGALLLASADDEADRPLALALLAAGAGYADPHGAPACAAALLAAEQVAREGHRGIFAAPGAILAASDEVAAGLHAGLFVVAEGRVRAAGATREKAYLNFGHRWRDDFTIIVAAKDFATILGDDLPVARLRGTVVRVRGVVREDGGPAVVVREASEIAVLEDPRAADAGKGEDR